MEKAIKAYPLGNVSIGLLCYFYMRNFDFPGILKFDKYSSWPA